MILKKIVLAPVALLLCLSLTACTTSTKLITALDTVAVVIAGAASAEPLFCGSVIPVQLCPGVEAVTAGAATLVKTIAMELASNNTNVVKGGTIGGAIALFVAGIDPVIRPYVSNIILALQAFGLQVNPPVVSVADKALKAKIDLEVVRPNFMQQRHLNSIVARMDKVTTTVHERRK